MWISQMTLWMTLLSGVSHLTAIWWLNTGFADMNPKMSGDSNVRTTAIWIAAASTNVVSNCFTIIQPNCSLQLGWERYKQDLWWNLDGHQVWVQAWRKDKVLKRAEVLLKPIKTFYNPPLGQDSDCKCSRSPIAENPPQLAMLSLTPDGQRW